VRAVRSERERLALQLEHERSARDRERIARDLHDSLGAQLSLAAVYADLLEQRREDPQAVKQLSQALAEAAEQSLLDLRELIEGLTPEGLTLSELVSLLRGRCERLASAASIRIEVRGGAGQAMPLSPASRYALLRISQEALCNAVRHARPQAIVLELSAADEHVRLSVSDNGRGFNPDAGSTGRGLQNMRRRASELGGALQISTGSSGTTIEAQVAWS
jgi:two-component system, NarL family, sensor histidine kinase DevS